MPDQNQMMAQLLARGQSPAAANVPGVASWAPGYSPQLQATGGIPQPPMAAHPVQTMAMPTQSPYNMQNVGGPMSSQAVQGNALNALTGGR